MNNALFVRALLFLTRTPDSQRSDHQWSAIPWMMPEFGADAIEAVQQLGRHGVTGGTIGQQLTLLHQ